VWYGMVRSDEVRFGMVWNCFWQVVIGLGVVRYVTVGSYPVGYSVVRNCLWAGLWFGCVRSDDVGLAMAW
jgi:hypothetical protein